MSKDVIEFEGVVTEVLPSMTFKVTLSNGHVITAYILPFFLLDEVAEDVACDLACSSACGVLHYASCG